MKEESEKGYTLCIPYIWLRFNLCLLNPTLRGWSSIARYYDYMQCKYIIMIGSSLPNITYICGLSVFLVLRPRRDRNSCQSLA